MADLPASRALKDLEEAISGSIVDRGAASREMVNRTIADMTPEAAGAWKQVTYNQYTAPAIEESSRHKTSVWAVFGLVALAIALRAIGFVDNLGPILLAAVAAVAVGPAISQAIKAGKGAAPLT